MYSYLNELEYKEIMDNYDYVRLLGGILKILMNDSNGMKNNFSVFVNLVNEYMEVVGDGFWNYGECYGK